MAAFATPEAGLSPLQAAYREESIDRACEVDKGHGRIEKRTWEVTTWLTEDLGPDWPGCQQVFLRERERRPQGEVEVVVVLEFTSLPRERAGGELLWRDSRPLGDRERAARRPGWDAP